MNISTTTKRFRVKEWRCFAGGVEECLKECGTNCIQIEGNIKCEGCAEGYKPENPPDESVCIGKW